VHLRATPATTEALGDSRGPVSDCYLSRDHEALGSVIEGDGSPGRLSDGVLPGTQAILYQMSLEPRRFSALERRVILCTKLFGSAIEDLDRSTWIEGNTFHRLALFPAGLEDAMSQVDRKPTWKIVRMDRHVGFRVPILHPVDRAVVMSFGTSHPDIAVLAVDPAARVADSPVVRRPTPEVIVGPKYCLSTGCWILRDQPADPARGAGKRLLIFGLQNGPRCGGLERLRDSQQRGPRSPQRRIGYLLRFKLPCFSLVISPSPGRLPAGTVGRAAEEGSLTIHICQAWYGRGQP